MMNEFLVILICLYTIYTRFLNSKITRIHEKSIVLWSSKGLRSGYCRSRQDGNLLCRLVLWSQDGTSQRRLSCKQSKRLTGYAVFLTTVSYAVMKTSLPYAVFPVRGPKRQNLMPSCLLDPRRRSCMPSCLF